MQKISMEEARVECGRAHVRESHALAVNGDDHFDNLHACDNDHCDRDDHLSGRVNNHFKGIIDLFCLGKLWNFVYNEFRIRNSQKKASKPQDAPARRFAHPVTQQGIILKVQRC